MSADVGAALKRGECPRVHQVTMLIASNKGRAEIWRENRRDVPELHKVDAVDGVDRPAALAAWRRLGVRFLNSIQQRRSFGAFACTLSKLRALQWQVEHEVPLMAMIEDDIRFRNGGHEWRKVLCFASAYLLHAPGAGSACAEFGAARLGFYGEAYLTSLHGARTILRRYCERGIRRNVDFTLNFMPETFYVRSSIVYALLRFPGKGHISKTGHALNETELASESAAWPLPSWCSAPPRCAVGAADSTARAAGAGAGPRWVR